MSSSIRIEKLQSSLHSLGVDALLIMNPVDLNYLTGIPMTAGKLLIQKKQADLFADSRYYQTCLEIFPFKTHLSPETKLPDIIKNQSLSIAFDSSTLTYEYYHLLIKALAPCPKKQTLLEIKNLGQTFRTYKDNKEIHKLKMAAELASQGFNYILDHIKVGVSEKSLTNKLHAYLIGQGAEAMSFDPIIAFGTNTSRPHHHPTDKTLNKDEPILFDFGIQLNGYMSDMTRMVYFGNIDPEIQKIGKIVLEAQQKAMSLCKPGVTNIELDKAAREYISIKGYGDYFGHGLGHGVGLEIHELPVISSSPSVKEESLYAGAVFTIEPGIYLPNKGGIRIEDTIVLTDSGYETLTSIPPEPLQI